MKCICDGNEVKVAKKLEQITLSVDRNSEKSENLLDYKKLGLNGQELCKEICEVPVEKVKSNISCEFN